MSLSLINNIPSLVAQEQIRQSQRTMEGLAQQLASGSRLNSMDGASLAVSSGLSAQIASLGQAQRNSNDALSLTQTADASMGQINNLLTRMNTLAVQAGNGSLSASQRGAINTQYQQLGSEIDRIAASSNYNGTPLLDGSQGTISFQVGANNSSNDRINMTPPNATGGNLGIAGTAVDTQANASAALSSIGNAMSNLSMQRAGLGATQMSLQSASDSAASQQLNLTAANSRIADTDYAQATSDLLRAQIHQQAAVAMAAQANSMPAAALTLLSGYRGYSRY